MIVNVTVDLNLKTKEVTEAVNKAAKLAMRDTVVDILGGAVRNHSYKDVTGNNTRSLAMEASGFGSGEGIVDQNKIEGAVYSTSGYGGYIETGTVKMAARPYIKPQADIHVPKLPERIKEHLSD